MSKTDDRVLPVPLGAMAARLGVSRAWLRGEVEARRIPALHAGARLLFDANTVEAMILRRARGEKAPHEGVSRA